MSHDVAHALSVYRSLAGTAPVYLAAEYTLVTAAGRSPLRSADNRTCLVKRSSTVRWPLLCYRRANPLEQSALTA